MKFSLNLGKPFGIRLKVHWTFSLLLVWVAYVIFSRGGSWTDLTGTLFFVLSVFVCVILHEFGHALTARQYGIQTRRIILLPIGGLAQLEKFPKDPLQEFVVAMAGPLVNVVIAAVLFFIALAFQTSLPNPSKPFLESGFVVRLMQINILLFLFNLIPAFPMDGGRVLRAILASRIDYVKATEYASRIGQVCAIIFALVGLFFNPVLIFIALFIFLGAQGEAAMVKTRNLLEGFTVKDAMMTRFRTIVQENTLQEAVQELLAGSDKDFLVVEDGLAKGILPRDNLIKALSKQEKSLTVKEVMLKDFPVAYPEEPLEKVVGLMKSRNIPILPVEKDGELIGAISLDNITELFLVRKPEDKINKEMIMKAR